MKPVVFPDEVFVGEDAYNIEVFSNGGLISVRAGDEGCGYRVNFADPAVIDALAVALKRAAQALRDSQRLTFGDLKPGEFFRSDKESGIWRKETFAYSRSVDGRIPGMSWNTNSDEQVTRVKATWQDVP